MVNLVLAEQAVPEPSGYNKCSICKEWGWTRSHVCRPVYRVWQDWADEEDGMNVHSNSAKAAAVKAAERIDAEAGDYPIVSGHDAVTFNVLTPDGEIVRYEVQGCLVPEYTASQVKE